MRLLTKLDLESCARIFIESFSKSPWNETWDYEIVLKRLHRVFYTPDSLGVVFESEKEILGFALGYFEPWHTGNHYYLKEMCVKASTLRKGIGTQILEYLQAQLLKNNAEKIYLLTSIGDLSEDFYKKNGFYTSSSMILMGKYFEKTEL